METAVYAETAGTVTEIAANPGTRVEPHDLILAMAVV
jgi:biotin carboxyl carrier protein